MIALWPQLSPVCKRPVTSQIRMVFSVVYWDQSGVRVIQLNSTHLGADGMCRIVGNAKFINYKSPEVRMIDHTE